MQNCPLFNQNQKNYDYNNYENQIETFEASCSKNNSNGTNNDENTPPNWYEKVRNLNLEKIDSQYNQLLSEYLNNYNRFLVLKGLQENASPSGGDASDFAQALKEAETKYTQKKSELEDLANMIEENNKISQNLIAKQTNDIENKTRSILKKNQDINNQTSVLLEKNKIMDSRRRQIEMGIEKNLYKRNIMYVLVFVNVIVLAILFGLLSKS